jgi:glutamate dehydrogenase
MMLGKVPASRLRLVDAIAKLARSDGPRALARFVDAFVRQYYRGVGDEDLESRTRADLAGAALAHLTLGLVRRPGRPLVRVFNPDPARDGFASANTVVMVVTDDAPFLVDSMSIVLNQSGLATHMIVHPVLSVGRDRAGRITGVAAEPAEGTRLESWQRFEIDRESDPARIAALESSIRATLDDVRVAVGDWQEMRRRARELATGLETTPPPLPTAEALEGKALLEWMEDNHFTFLGYRYYRLERGRGTDRLVPDAASGLGILRGRRPGHPVAPTTLAGEVRAHARDKELLVITKANATSTIHRATYLDYVGVKTFDARGEVSGEHRFLGLWTSSAYSHSPRDIPVLRHKVQKVIGHFGLSPTSHDGKAVLHVLETYPRDELFQASTADLIRIVRGIVNLYERQQVRLFARRDAFHRFYSLLVYVPRDRYNTEVRHRIESIVREALGGTAIESTVQLSESVLARVHLIVRTPPSAREVDTQAVERQIAAAVVTWNDGLKAALAARHDEVNARRLLARYAGALPTSYQEDTPPEAALADLNSLEQLARDPSGLHLRLERPSGAPPAALHLKIYRAGQPVAISDVLPSLENLGLRIIAERPYELALPDGPAWIQDFELEHSAGRPVDLDSDGPRLEEAIAATWSGRAENDGFNRLVLAAGLSWREAMLLRAYARWIAQTGSSFSQGYMESVLAGNARAAGRLARLFVAQFDPGLSPKQRDAESARLRRGLDADLAAVVRLDEDRILRAFRAAIDATLRTNYFQVAAAAGAAPGGPAKPYLSIKLDPSKVPDLPEPRPMFEIWVYSPRMEGVHLRKGRVARGGLRWSDRYEDFRTEVLGLMKAQNVKNTLIVPVGAKGGFVCRKLPAGRDEVQREVVACYQDFIRGLLDLTDNIVDGKVVPPARTVRRDPDDTYLVVAADKGTATFSDIANAIAREYGFWLDDAFASGGSAGYDHKKIAITARGAWECVKRHFRELGVDVDRQEITVAGIGDMSGDVFGNGLLRSRHLRLVAAFDHRHVFIDPNPDAAKSFKERERMFRLPRSSWADYDRKVLSAGGGVWSRSDKSLKLTPQARALLGLESDTTTPNEVVRAILKLQVDLLWNGGIGTYVKATDETQAQAGDKTNDAVRVDGRELRARVVGEGGNLGFTQRGRIEYALNGGRLNTDFIDNSAGVNCSDVEVNIKILLSLAARRRGLKRPARDRLLARMTDEVASLVLRNNYLQSQAISAVESRARERLGEHAHAIRTLERSGDLDRRLEFLPDEEALTERAQRGLGLTRPEISVVLSYSKIWLYQQLIHSDVPEDAYLSNELERYFPAAIRAKYSDLLALHPLKREIIATATTNSLVNRMGPVFALRAQEDTGAGLGQVARAFAIAREATNMRDLWAVIEGLDNRVAAGIQYEMIDESARVLRHGTYWVLAHSGQDLDVERAVARLKPGLAELVEAAPRLLEGRLGERIGQKRARYLEAGVPEATATRIATLELLQSGLDIVDVAARRRVPILQAARAYLRLGTLLDLDWLRLQVETLAAAGHWQSVARGTLRDNVYELHRSLTDAILAGRRRGDAIRAVDAWLEQRSRPVEHLRRTFADMANLPAIDFATLSVALQSLRRLSET